MTIYVLTEPITSSNLLSAMEEEVKSHSIQNEDAVQESPVKKSRSTLSVIIGIIAVAVISGIYFYVSRNSTSNQDAGTQSTANEPENQVVVEESVQALSFEEVVKHNTSEDCYFIIDGKVYDVTEFISKGVHPGGEVILQGCGKDATDFFYNRPGKGDAHSEKAKDLVDDYYIGDLVN